MGFEGQTVSKNKNGQFSTNEDGSGSFMSSADVNAVDSDGVALAGNREASGEWQANSEGGRDYSGSRSATSDNGQNTAATTNAKTTRDGNGNGTFQSVRDRQNGDGTTDRFERRASVKRDGNGVQRSRSKTRTRGD